MEKRIIVVASALGATAIILGAFGAHALKAVLGPAELATFETGVRYQVYNALYLLFVSLAPVSSSVRNMIMWLVLSGVILFSGSIYLLATDSLNDFNFKVIGFLTPIGGLLIILGWCLLMAAILRRKS